MLNSNYDDGRGVKMGFGSTTPILRSFDEAKAKEFYVDFLGFQVDWEQRHEPTLPLYMQLSLDGCVIHLSEHHGDCSPGATLRIHATALETYQQELIAKKYGNARPGLQRMPWGSTEMSVPDPFGNRLVFTDTADAGRMPIARAAT